MSTDQQHGEQGTHFWHMTIQAERSAPGNRLSTFSGTITPKPGDTRFDLFNVLLAGVAARVSAADPGIDPGNVVVMAFGLQPNQL